MSQMQARDILGSLTMADALYHIPPGSYDVQDTRNRETFISWIDRQSVQVKKAIYDARQQKENSTPLRKKRKKNEQSDIISKAKKVKARTSHRLYALYF